MPNANNFPLFVQTQNSNGLPFILASSCANNTPPNTQLLATIGVNGGVVTKASVIPLGNATVHLVYLFLSKDSGATKQLFAIATIPQYTASVSVGQVETLFNFSEDAPERLQAGDQIYAGLSSAQAAGIMVNLRWGNF